MMSPSAPAATPARAIDSTYSQYPVPWLGSTTTGRCESRFTTGTALRSRVKRVAVSKVRMPRSQRITCGLPPRSEEHTSELQSRLHLVCRLLLEKKKKRKELNCLTQKM